jgi:hypothetical protein
MRGYVAETANAERSSGRVLLKPLCYHRKRRSKIVGLQRPTWVQESNLVVGRH